MFNWLRRRRGVGTKRSISLGYKNKKGLDLADYMLEGQARRFQNVLTSEPCVAFYLELSIQYYKIHGFYNDTYANKLSESISDVIDDADSDIFCSAIFRWIANRPPLKPTE